VLHNNVYLILLPQFDIQMTDKTAQQDALRAHRASELFEREWRAKESIEMHKLKAREENLRKCRLEQLQEREDDIAQEAKSLRSAFVKNLEKQKAALAKSEVDKIKKHEESQKFSRDIKAQICEKVLVKEREKVERSNGELKMKKEEEEKQRRLDVLRKEKIQGLVDMGVPEKYCADIVRKMAVVHK